MFLKQHLSTTVKTANGKLNYYISEYVVALSPLTMPNHGPQATRTLYVSKNYGNYIS